MKYFHSTPEYYENHKSLVQQIFPCLQYSQEMGFGHWKHMHYDFYFHE